MKKYELTDETRKYMSSTLHRIRAVRSFGDVKTGDVGGWVESEYNLSHDGDCWVYDDGVVRDHGLVCDYGEVRDQGVVRDHGEVRDHGIACDHGKVCDHGVVCDHGKVSDQGEVRDFGVVRDQGVVSDDGVVRSLNDIFTISHMGSRGGTTTFYNTKDGSIGVSCGCFSGSIADFEIAVKKTHCDNQYAQEYMAAIALAKIKIKKSGAHCKTVKEAKATVSRAVAKKEINSEADI